ncbi:helix-turn-helix domain-containing protein [Actinomadura oligospora]|uniref:helix-turn-helix domain-containing protein n=1 Tax=Actinomadura oligospora TaxID=111804 RepID=UPI00047AFCD9|nr:helix-turn-helix transcriptional regulator [Actinomadura oligospora]
MTDRPTIRTRRLASELRLLRERATLNLDEVVTALHSSGGGRWSVAKLSRIERAAQRIKSQDLEQLLDLYEVPPERREGLQALARGARQRGWWDAYADTIHSDYTTYIRLEAEARSLRCFDGLAINGLLQTDEYTGEVCRVGMMQFGTQTAIERRIDVRRVRQRVLDDREPEPLRLWSILDEGALRRQVGGPEVMHRQYEALLEVANLPNVMLQVLPFEAGAHAAVTGTFAIMDFADAHMPDVVYLDGLTSALYEENDRHVYRYSLAFNQLAMSAIGVDESLEFIADLAGASAG